MVAYKLDTRKNSDEVFLGAVIGANQNTTTTHAHPSIHTTPIYSDLSTNRRC